MKHEETMYPNYCIICQEWQKSHQSYSCPYLICKFCNSKGHANIDCPELIFGYKDGSKEVTDIKHSMPNIFQTKLKRH